MSDVIFTDALGAPFARPEPPAPGASIEERIAYQRALYAYKDAIAGCANAAFASAFRSAVGAR